MSIMGLPDYLSYKIQINKYFVRIEGYCADTTTTDFVIEIKFDENRAETTFYARYKDSTEDTECFSTTMATFTNVPFTFSEAISSVLYEFAGAVYNATNSNEPEEKEKERKDIVSVILVVAKEFTNDVITIQGDADVEFSIPEPKDEPGKWN